MRFRLPRLRLDLALSIGCRRCGSRRRVRKAVGLCEDCRPKTELDRWCESRGVTLNELAERAGIGPATIWRIVGGHTVRPEMLERVSAVTKIPADRIQEVRRAQR